MSDPLLDIAEGTLLDARKADVGRSREKSRRARLRRLALVLALPAGFLWYRLATGHPFNVFALPNIPWLLLLYVAVPVLFLVGMGGVYWAYGRSPHQLIRPEQIDVRLADVVGIDVIKAEVVRSLNLFLAHRTFARDMGGRPRRGLLFEGPPGTGKTFLAKAIAAEANVPFLFATATSFQSGLQGATQRKVRAFFRKLRAVARKEGGAIGFIDEFDALGAARSAVSASTADDLLAPGMRCGGLVGLPTLGTPTLAPVTVNPAVTTPYLGGGDLGMAVQELLVQLQSFDQPPPGQRLVGALIDAVNSFLPATRQIRKPPIKPANILLIASTNRADSLDPALLRPGRFDQRLSFDRPDKAGRRALLAHFLARKAHTDELDDPERIDALAAVTPGYTPAMLEGLLDDALVHALQDGRRAMTWRDVEQARLDSEIGLGQPVGYTDHEKRLIATHEAGHATVAWLVAPHRRLEVLTIVKRRNALGLLAHNDRDDVYTRSRSEMLGLIQIAMGGQAAEEVFFGDVSTGPGGDLAYATTLAAQMVGACGMTDTLISYAAVQSNGLNDTNIVGRVLADQQGRAKVDELLAEQKLLAASLIEANRHLVAALRDALLERHELIGHEITDVLEEAARRGVTRPESQTSRVIDLTDDALAAARTKPGHTLRQ